ncbi:MAG: phosphate ABC transporter permease subunit PstC, partial [Planifilum fimeticola]
MSQVANKGVSASGGRFRRPRTWRNAVESVIPRILLVCAFLSVITTFAILLTLLVETASFFEEVSIIEFVTGTEWTALFSGDQQKFGVLPLVAGTLLVTAGAAIVAMPIGLASAIYLSEYAPDRVRRVLKPVLEVLAGIPTIVYGFFALTFVTPLLKKWIPNLDTFN